MSEMYIENNGGMVVVVE